MRGNRKGKREDESETFFIFYDLDFVVFKSEFVFVGLTEVQDINPI